MSENTDLRILYDGIEGKTSIDEKSGLNIKNDLLGVAKKLNNKENRPRIMVDLAEDATSKALSASLKKIINSLKIEPVKIKFDTSNGSSGSKNNSKPIKTEIYDTDQLKKDQINYITTVQKGQQMIDTIVRQLKSNGIHVGKVELLADAKGSVKSFTAEAVTATGAVDKLNFSLAQLKNGGDGNPYSGFIQNNLKSSDGIIKENEKYFKQQKASLDGILYGAEKGRNKVSNLNEIKTKYDEIEKEIVDLGNKSGAISDGERQNVKNLTSDLKLLIAEIKKAENAKPIQVAPQKTANPVVSQTKLQTFDADISKLENLKNQSKELSDAFAELRKRRDALESNGAITTDNEILTAYKEQYQFVTKLAGAEKTRSAESSKHSKEALKNLRELENAQSQFNNKVTEFNKFGYNNTAFNKNRGFKAEYEALGVRYQSLIGSDDIVAMKQLNSEFDVFKRKVTEAGLLGQTFTDKLSAQMNKLGVYFTATGLMMGAFNQVKNMIKDVVALDGAVTDLQIATGGTREETEKLLDTYSRLGKELGSSTSSVAASADDWLRQGKSIETTNKLIKDSIMLSKLGKIDTSEATTALTTMSKAYNVADQDITSLVDKLTAVDMVSNTTAGGLAKSFQETAVSARMAGIDINRMAGYLAVVSEVSGDSSESVGTFFKSFLSRMSSIKEGRMVDPDTGEDLSTVETVLDNIGIKLRNGQDQFRNFGTVLDETAVKWKEMEAKGDTVGQAKIASALGLTRQQEKAKILFENYDTALKYADIAANSLGTAEAKFNDSYLKSVEAAQERFTAQFETLSRTVIDSGIITGVIDGGTGLLGTLTAIIDKVKILPTLITAAAGASSAFLDKGELKIKSSKTYLRPFTADGNIGQDQYEYGVLCLEAA